MSVGFECFFLLPVVALVRGNLVSPSMLSGSSDARWCMCLGIFFLDTMTGLVLSCVDVTTSDS